jgi:hypothetical protein
MADAIIDKFISSNSFGAAKANCRLVEELTSWKPDYKARLREAVANNGQISGSWGVPNRIEVLLAKRDPDPPEPATVGDLDDEIPF